MAHRATGEPIHCVRGEGQALRNRVLLRTSARTKCASNDFHKVREVKELFERFSAILVDLTLA